MKNVQRPVRLSGVGETGNSSVGLEMGVVRSEGCERQGWTGEQGQTGESVCLTF